MDHLVRITKDPSADRMHRLSDAAPLRPSADEFLPGHLLNKTNRNGPAHGNPEHPEEYCKVLKSSG